MLIYLLGVASPFIFVGLIYFIGYINAIRRDYGYMLLKPYYKLMGYEYVRKVYGRSGDYTVSWLTLYRKDGYSKLKMELGYRSSFDADKTFYRALKDTMDGKFERVGDMDYSAYDNDEAIKVVEYRFKKGGYIEFMLRQ